MTTISDPRRALVDQFPRYLTRRMRGWSGARELMETAGIAPPQGALLRAIVMEAEPGTSMSVDELRANLFNPYSTVHVFVGTLPVLVGQGLLAQSGERYSVTPQGHALIERFERAARAYLASLDVLPAADCARLADRLAELAGSMWAADEPAAKPHQARVRRLPPVEGEPAMARLDPAVYALWMARDDAHNAAWRAAGLDGPTFDLLSRLWSGEAGTRDELIACVHPGQRPADVERGLAELSRRGFVQEDAAALRLMPAGRAARDAIEAETDRVYFAPWVGLAPGEAAWMHDTFRALCEGLPL
jgi:hypothetical protein